MEPSRRHGGAACHLGGYGGAGALFANGERHSLRGRNRRLGHFSAQPLRRPPEALDSRFLGQRRLLDRLRQRRLAGPLRHEWQAPLPKESRIESFRRSPEWLSREMPEAAVTSAKRMALTVREEGAGAAIPAQVASSAAVAARGLHAESRGGTSRF